MDYAVQYAAAFEPPMSDEAAFHHAIHDAVERDDTLPPLVYADWLEEHNKPAQASVIRQHVDRAGTDDYDAIKPAGWNLASFPTISMRFQPSGFTYAHATLNYPENTHGRINLRIQSHKDRRRHFSWTSARLPKDQIEAMIHQLRREGVTTSPVTDNHFPPEQDV